MPWPPTRRCARSRWWASPTRAGARCPVPSCRSCEGQEVEATELIAWVRERLAAFKVPREVVVLDDLPKGGTGKIQKQALRDRPA